MTTYPSLAAFYAGRDDRRLSGESDYGVHWHERRGRDWPPWRVSYVQATGEVYAVQAGGPGEVRVLGVVKPDPDRRHEEGDFATGATYYRTLDHVLAGWAELGKADRTLTWVTRQLAAFANAGGHLGGGAEPATIGRRDGACPEHGDNCPYVR